MQSKLSGIGSGGDSALISTAEIMVAEGSRLTYLGFVYQWGSVGHGILYDINNTGYHSITTLLITKQTQSLCLPFIQYIAQVEVKVKD